MKISVNHFTLVLICLLGLTFSSSDSCAQEKELVVLESAQKMPQFIGGKKAFNESVQKDLNYPKLAIAQGIAGEVLVMFVVDINGELTDFEILESIDLECDMAAIKAIHSTSGQWVSGMQDGKNVNVYATARVPFHLPKAKTALSYSEQPPKYKDGDEALFKLIRDNVSYPSVALDQGLQGKVFVKFIVDSHGYLSDFEILQGVSIECNKEAIRAILMTDGDWIPAMHEGEKVNAWVTIPVFYKVLIAPAADK